MLKFLLHSFIFGLSISLTSETTRALPNPTPQLIVTCDSEDAQRRNVFHRISVTSIEDENCNVIMRASIAEAGRDGVIFQQRFRVQATKDRASGGGSLIHFYGEGFSLKIRRDEDNKDRKKLYSGSIYALMERGPAIRETLNCNWLQ